MDTFSKSDPQIIMFEQEHGKWRESGRTEIIWDNLNPKFVKSFIVDYHFEAQQPLRFVVVDIDNEKSSKIEDQDLIGEAYCTVGEIVGAKGSQLTKELMIPNNPNHHAKQKRGYLQIRAEEVQGVNDEVVIKVRAKQLDAKGWWGLASSDPFLEISKTREDNDYTPVYKSEQHHKSSNVSFKPIVIKVEKLCNGDYYRQLQFKVYHFHISGTHREIGRCLLNLDQLRKMSNTEVPIISEKAKKKKGSSYKNSGILVFESVIIERVPSFLEYVRGGYQISLLVAIDFTLSNQDFRNPNSLHYLNPNPNILNDYQQAILSVGNILNYYDSDKKYPVFGIQK